MASRLARTTLNVCKSSYAPARSAGFSSLRTVSAAAAVTKPSWTCTKAATTSSTWTLGAARRQVHSSSALRAEEVPETMPFESNIMNLLSNNDEFRELVTNFAERMQKLLGIDVNNGEVPGMQDMMKCAQDPEIREMSVKLTKMLQDEGINLSPDTLKYIWGNMKR